ncbi:MAG: hypothetical protein ABI539_15150 [Acidobacteriota bacterium]
MMEALKNIEDRFLVLGFALAVLIAYVTTRDALVGDILKIMIGVAAGIFSSRSEKQLVMNADGPQTKQIVSEFLNG